MGEVETLVELKYFSPFDLNLIPESVLKQVHFAAFGMAYKREPSTTLGIHETLTILCDPWELKQGCRKALIQHHRK